MKIGISGHQKLEDPSLWNWVSIKLNNIVVNYTDELIGISSLAIGADQLFADTILKHKGSLHIIVPFEDYELKFSRGEDRESYFRLLHKAKYVDVLDKEESEESSYLAAGKKVVDLSNLLIAVWDGESAVGLGGTGDIVKYAKQNSKRIVHINPITKTVTEK
jgi:hypothetical protein